MIPVTKPFLPPQEAYHKMLKRVWDSNILTNMGPLAKELEVELTKHLDVSNLLFVTNGTIALQMAIKALELKGEVITTPFSFVATTSCIVWEGCEPVFVDIDAASLNIDPNKIEAAITDKTSAILATHVYGNPCDVLAIEEIAKKHQLKVIYDGAHAFDVKVHGKSVFEYGDISICSLHATKLYHSGEGGFIVTKEEGLLQKLKYIMNFGISGHSTFKELGINGKNSEFHAAMGLVNLHYIEAIHNKRSSLVALYNESLKDFKHTRPKWHAEANQNFAYYPILLENEEVLLELMAVLADKNIHTRRYFYPSLASALPYLPKLMLPITEGISKRILCLPLYYDLTLEEVELVSGILLKSLSSANAVL